MSGTFLGMPPFPEAAKAALADAQLRHNLAHATSTIRAKRAGVVAEVADWEDLRTRAATIKDEVLAHLDGYLNELEAALTAAGATVHRAVDAEEACRIVGDPGDRPERGSGGARHTGVGDRSRRADRATSR